MYANNCTVSGLLLPHDYVAPCTCAYAAVKLLLMWSQLNTVIYRSKILSLYAVNDYGAVWAAVTTIYEKNISGGEA